MTRHELRGLLSRPGSWNAIAAAAAAGALARLLPVDVVDHLGDVYRRLERAADDADDLAALRLAVLVHEQPPDALPALLERAGLSELAPTVTALVRGFGQVWKLASDDACAAYVAGHGPHLTSLLAFEVAHEGRATASMRDVARLAGCLARVDRWSARLAI